MRPEGKNETDALRKRVEQLKKELYPWEFKKRRGPATQHLEPLDLQKELEGIGGFRDIVMPCINAIDRAIENIFYAYFFYDPVYFGTDERGLELGARWIAFKTKSEDALEKILKKLSFENKVSLLYEILPLKTVNSNFRQIIKNLQITRNSVAHEINLEDAQYKQFPISSHEGITSFKEDSLLVFNVLKEWWYITIAFRETTSQEEIDKIIGPKK